IQGSETALATASQTAEQSFSNLIAPGIIDFQPLQAQPNVTDIGGQIRPMPTTDAGTVRRDFTNNLTPLTTLTPSEAFQGSFKEQEYNRNRDFEHLMFQ